MDKKGSDRFAGDDPAKPREIKKRIEHSLRCFAYAQLLGRLEGLDPAKQFVLELTAIFA